MINIGFDDFTLIYDEEYSEQEETVIKLYLKPRFKISMVI